MADVEKMATTVLGSGKEQFYPALLHLVVADLAYCDANKDTGGRQAVEGTCVHTLVHQLCVYVQYTVTMLMHTTLNTHYLSWPHMQCQLPHNHSHHIPATYVLGPICIYIHHCRLCVST